MSITVELVRDALQGVYDPCSVASRSPLSIVDMGMVTRIELNGRDVAVAICPTNRGCTLMPSIMGAAEAALNALPGIERVQLSVDSFSSWTPDAISEGGKKILEERRARSRSEMPVEPQQWKRQQAVAH